MMSDIDFDELDREVNKLVSKNDDGQETSEDPIKIEPSSTSSEENSPEDQAKDGSTKEPQLSAKPRGRFMDVVHPSSDMSSSEDAHATLTPSSERKSLTPLSSQDSEETDTSDSDDETPDNEGDTSSEVSIAEENTTDTAEKSQDSTDMPDPIDVHEALQAKSSDETDDDAAKEQNSEDDKEDDDASIDKPSSAFLADAQVEKRPLGQFSEEPSDELPKDDPVSKTAQAAIDQANGKDGGEEGEGEELPPEEPILPLPPELEKDLVAIEAGESPDDILSGEDVKKPENAEDESEESKKNDDLEKAEEGGEKIGASGGSQEADEKAAATSLLASGSIPQQYKIALQQKVEGSDDPKQLFAAEHHATGPSKQAGKQHSKVATILQWVLIVVGVLLLGATIGAGLYVFVSNQ